MKSSELVECVRCAAQHAATDPFCLECGLVAVSRGPTGPFAVKVNDVPSQKLREQTLDLLKAWFPLLDPVQTGKRLAGGQSILVDGVDERSAKAIIDALKRFRVDARMVSHEESKSGIARLFNPGLIVSGLALGLAALFGGLILSVGLLAVAVAAPFAYSALRGRSEPLVTHSNDPDMTGMWIPLAARFEQSLKTLDPETAQSIRSVASTVFRIVSVLESNSVVAGAAGGVKGELSDYLTQAIDSALDLAAAFQSSEGEERIRLKSELEDLAEALQKVADKFLKSQQALRNDPTALSTEIRRIGDRVEKISAELGETARPRPRLQSE